MIAKPTSDAILSSAASTASSSFVASRPATRKPPELTSRCYASQQQGSGSKLSTRPSFRMPSRREELMNKLDSAAMLRLWFPSSKWILGSIMAVALIDPHAVARAQDVKIAKSDVQIDALDPGIKLFV